MIRAATADDLPRILELGRAMHAESRYRALKYSPERASVMIGYAINQGGVFVAERDGVIVGFFAGIAEPHWFSDDVFALDLALFVEPAHRGGMTACRLIDAFLTWAEGRGAVMTDILINTGVRTETTARLFERLGGQRAGLIYTWGTA